MSLIIRRYLFYSLRYCCLSNTFFQWHHVDFAKKVDSLLFMQQKKVDCLLFSFLFVAFLSHFYCVLLKLANFPLKYYSKFKNDKVLLSKIYSLCSIMIVPFRTSVQWCPILIVTVGFIIWQRNVKGMFHFFDMTERIKNVRN